MHVMRKASLGLATLTLLGLAAAHPAHAQELVTNGGFETGDFTGWTLSGNSGFISIVSSPVHSGQFAASFGAVGSLTFLTQNLATTPGQDYNISFWLQNNGGDPNEFVASFDGTTLADFVNLPGQDYTEYTYTATATGSSTALQFGFQQNPSFFHFDDVSVTPATTAVPEPSQTAALGVGVLGLMGLMFVARRRKGAVA